MFPFYNQWNRKYFIPALSAALLFSVPVCVNAQSVAIKVLGQSTFTTSAGATTATGMSQPIDVTNDASGNLYVSDRSNHRVLIYKNASAKANGAAADYVLGQANFTTRTTGTTSSKFNTNYGVMADVSGNLYVTDQLNNRLLIFKGITAKVNNSTLTNGIAADYVIGQTTLTATTSGTAVNKLFQPAGMAMDTAGNLFVSDLENNRVLIYNGVRTAVNNSTFVNGMSASKVLGQPDFVSGDINSGLTGPNAANMYLQRGITVSDAGDLYVADLGNNRVLIFRNVLAKANGAAADVVLGQPDFISDQPGTGLDQMDQPIMLKVLGTNGPLEISEIGNNRVLVYHNPAGAATGRTADRQIGNGGATSASTLNVPYGMTYDAAGGLWVVDLLNNRVVQYSLAVALPVKFISFTASASGNTNVIRWTMTVGSTFRAITVQRSTNGRDFSDLQMLNQPVAENIYNDAQPAPGSNYYRLMIADDNGAITYSTVAMVSRNPANSGYVTVSPVPAADQVTITNTDAGMKGNKAMITDIQGRLKHSFNLDDVQKIDIATWPSGIYLLRITGMEVIRLVKH